MRAGLLNEIIEILKPVIVKTETGTESTTYETIYRIRSSVKTETGTRENLNGDIAYLHNVTFQIRRFYGFTEQFRVRWNNKEYRIISIDKNRERQYISIFTEEVNE